MDKIAESLTAIDDFITGTFMYIVERFGVDKNGNMNLFGVLFSSVFHLLLSVFYFFLFVMVFLFPLLFIMDTFMWEGTSIFTDIKCNMLTWLPFVDRCGGHVK